MMSTFPPVKTSISGLKLSNFRGTAILALRFLSKIGHQGHANYFLKSTTQNLRLLVIVM